MFMFFKESVIRISWKHFSTKCSCKKHQLTNGSLGVEAISSNNFEPWNLLYPDVLTSIKEIMNVMSRYRDTNGFALIGLDFIFDNNCKAWILESNTYPCLYYADKDPQLQPLLNTMMNSVLDIL